MSSWYDMSVAANPLGTKDQQCANESATEARASVVPPGSNSMENERPSEASNKRLACNPCRDRKVRCDRQHPTCGRCGKMGSECHYSSPSKQGVSKLDLSRLLVTLHNRLEQAEAQLAFGSPLLNNQQFASTWSDLGAFAAPGSAVLSAPELNIPLPSRSQEFHTGQASHGVVVPSVTRPQSSIAWSNQESSSASGAQFSAMASTIPTEFSAAPSVDETRDLEPMFQGLTPSSFSDTGSQSDLAIPNSLLSRLHTSFFEVFHPALPIVNESRFQNELAESSDLIQVQALSQAIAALGALATSELSFAVEACYNKARDLLDICERQEDNATLANINALQTCILLSVYELKRPNFARAWMTLGRGIRLAKMMCLESAESDGRASEHQDLLSMPLAPGVDRAEVEERRRTFWQLYVLDGFASMRSNSTPVFDGRQILVPIPCPGELSSITESREMPSLPEVSERSGTSSISPSSISPSSISPSSISPFAGIVVMVSLYRLCFDHASAQSPSYPFWDTHYRISKLITHCRNNLLASCLTQASQSSAHPLCVILRMNLAAVEINLHEAAIVKVENEQFPTGLSEEAITRCQSAAMQVVEAVQTGQQLTGNDLEAFQQSSPFYTWAMTKATQVYVWMLAHRTNNVSSHANALRILSGAMEELVNPDHIRPGLLEQVTARLAETGRPAKRRYVQASGGF